MSHFRIFVAVAVFLSAIANASPKPAPLQIKVLSAQNHTFQRTPFYPPNCNWRDLDAYCDNSSPVTYVENTMVVRENSGQSVEISCTVYNPWSRCVDLPVNRTFQAKKEKRGLEIRYQDDHHKWRKEFYEIVSEDAPER